MFIWKGVDPPSIVLDLNVAVAGDCRPLEFMSEMSRCSKLPPSIVDWWSYSFIEMLWLIDFPGPFPI